MNTRAAFATVGAVVLLLSSCGGGDDSEDRPVVELSDDGVESLCEEFHDRVCEGTVFSQCSGACRATCRDPGTAALMRQQCAAPITVAQVHECADLVATDDQRAFEICTMGGGCVFDVFDVTCP